MSQILKLIGRENEFFIKYIGKNDEEI